jgi:hypothetical protein
MIRKMHLWQRLTLLAIIVFAAITFLTGLNWGLPSRDADTFLFANRLPWTGQQIMQLAGSWDTQTARGADIAMHPLQGRDQPVVLNDTDAKRAEIVRRYRLYSNQPDEMITFRSLSRMKPARLDFDPAMYQYGGLWIYPVGGLLKIGSLLHLITLRSDLAYYLDHPEAFGRFYIAARFYSAAWGIAGVLVVFFLARQLFNSFVAAAGAAAIYASMPVVVDLAHEAKPHLAGTVLTLLTVSAALRYARTGCRKSCLAAGAFAGLSMGMVLTGYVAFAALPMMSLARPEPWNKRFKVTFVTALIGLAIFTLTNPYLPYNILFHRQVLHSNVGNYGTFYKPGFSVAALYMTWRSLLEGISYGPLILGLAGVLICIFQRNRFALIPAAVGAIVLIQFILLAEGKTAEYARFALTLDVLLAIAAAGAIAELPITAREKQLACTLLVAGTLFYGIRYDINFIADNSSHSTRRDSADAIAEATHQSTILNVYAEPAPYCLPPVDLFHWQIFLQPRDAKFAPAPAAVGIRTVDYPRLINPLAPVRASSPISWANKPFEISGPAPVSTPAQQP